MALLDDRPGALPGGPLGVDPELRLGARAAAAADGARFDVLDPASGVRLAEVADATPADAEAAMDLAADAFAAVRATPARVRGSWLLRAAALLRERAEEAARLITLEAGKPLAESRGEVAYAADFLQHFGELAPHVDGRTAPFPDGGGRLEVRPEPVGPCVLVTPWNFPLAMVTRKLGPALAAGCTAVVKPAPQTPLSALWTADLLEESGVPDGAVSVLPTTRAEEVVAALLADPRTRKLSFTGSTAVGRALMRQAADGLLRLSLELGGNNPFLVFADADLDLAVDALLVAKLRNAGQACTAANRLLVEAPVAEELTRRFVGRVAGLAVGPGLATGTDLGPLVDARQRDRVAALVDDAVARGASVRCGGAPGAGTTFPPTVLTDVPPDARVLRKEVFGPVLPVVPFADEAEALALADPSPHGLAAYVCTRDADRVERVADALGVGMVGVNTGLVSSAAAPFGGVGASGFGREGGPEGLEEYLQRKYVARRPARAG